MGILKAKKLLWKSAHEIPSANLEKILSHLSKSESVSHESKMVKPWRVTENDPLGASYLLLETQNAHSLVGEMEILRRDHSGGSNILVLCEIPRDETFGILRAFPEVQGVLSPSNSLLERRIEKILGWLNGGDDTGEKTLWEVNLNQKRQGNDLKIRLQESLADGGNFEGYAEDMITVLTELLSNAFFNAPYDQHTQDFPFKKLPRDLNVTLGEQKQVKVMLAEGPQFYSLKVTDPFGSLERKVFLENLERSSKRQHDQLRNEGPGSGVGLYTIYEYATEILVSIHTGVSTLFECSFYKSSRKKSYMEMGKNLVIERHDGG